jgi:FdhE protein
MPYLTIPAAAAIELAAAAEERWESLLAIRPELASAISLQRRLLTLVIELKERLEQRPLPRLSLPGRYLAAKLARGVPVLAGEPIPLPTNVLMATLLDLCRELATGGAGDAAEHVQSKLESGNLNADSLLAASLARDQTAIRSAATHHGLAADLVWLVAELAVGPFAHVLQRTVCSDPSQRSSAQPAAGERALAAALDNWNFGYCPACGSWPAMAEVVEGHRAMRCSFCAAAWELNSYACVYCGEDGEPFVTAAPNEERKDRRLELCGGCGSYLKTIDTATFSPFPLLSVGDLDTMDLDMAAMEHGYARPPLKEFARPVRR